MGSRHGYIRAPPPFLLDVAVFATFNTILVFVATYAMAVINPASFPAVFGPTIAGGPAAGVFATDFAAHVLPMLAAVSLLRTAVPSIRVGWRHVALPLLIGITYATLVDTPRVYDTGALRRLLDPLTAAVVVAAYVAAAFVVSIVQNRRST